MEVIVFIVVSLNGSTKPFGLPDDHREAVSRPSAGLARRANSPPQAYRKLI